jgi:hypothetical protein
MQHGLLFTAEVLLVGIQVSPVAADAGSTCMCPETASKAVPVCGGSCCSPLNAAGSATAATGGGGLIDGPLCPAATLVLALPRVAGLAAGSGAEAAGSRCAAALAGGVGHLLAALQVAGGTRPVMACLAMVLQACSYCGVWQRAGGG